MTESIELSKTDGVIAPEQTGKQEMSVTERLEALSAKATALYGMKDYAAAADVYSEATELQAEANGEMSVENADLLYAYGRCLFYVAQKTSEVLGGTAAQAQLKQEKEKKGPKKRKEKKAQNGSAQAGSSSSAPQVTGGDPTTDTILESHIPSAQMTSNPDNKSLFQITGDENWTDSEEDEEDPNAEEEEEEEEDDDFANSFELLDLARILYLRKLDSIQASTAASASKGEYIPSIDLTPPVREIKSRIADIYDLQAEIGLEGEKFDNSVTDLKACLALKEELEPPESSLLAECHYKLSLALEVAGQDQKRDEQGNPIGEIVVNWDLRNESILQQEKAIHSCQLRVSKETKSLEEMPPSPEKDASMARIEDVQEMISEMQDRLTELRKPPVNVKEETERDMNQEMMAGVLGQIMGQGGHVSKEEQKAQLAQVIANATDLSSMVKKKKQVKGEGSGTNGNGSGTKRKVGFVDEDDEGGKGKKAKVEDVEDSGL